MIWLLYCWQLLLLNRLLVDVANDRIHLCTGRIPAIFLQNLVHVSHHADGDSALNWRSYLGNLFELTWRDQMKVYDRQLLLKSRSRLSINRLKETNCECNSSLPHALPIHVAQISNNWLHWESSSNWHCWSNCCAIEPIFFENCRSIPIEDSKTVTWEEKNFL